MSMRIAVIGPNAGEAHLGGYSGTPKYAISILEGIKKKIAGRAEVLYAEGCRITESKPVWEEDKVVPADPNLDQARISEALEAMSKADVGIVVVGENEQTSREAWSPTHLGDRDSLDLLGRQDELVSRLLATGKPLVVENAQSAAVYVPRGDGYRLRYLSGRWAGEWQLNEEPVHPGVKVLESRRGSTSHQTNPFHEKADPCQGPFCSL